MAYFPFYIDIENKNILVVGGGTVALRKIEKLSPFKPSITVVSPKICEEILKFNVKAVEREFDDNDLSGTFCVISATDNEQVNSHIFELCKEKNILVNTVDDKEKCGFIFPAIVQKNSVTAGITTSGKSPIYAKYLKEQNVDDIVIDVYGTGDYLNEFLDKIFDNEVEDYICYCGETSNPKNQMKTHDAVVDFTLNHSFGMPYIEAILNGKMVYCTENTGSREVLNGIDGCIYTSYADLLDKIRKFPQVTDDQLRSNYDKISKVYSREVLGEKFVDFLEK